MILEKKNIAKSKKLVKKFFLDYQRLCLRTGLMIGLGEWVDLSSLELKEYEEDEFLMIKLELVHTIEEENI